MLIVLHPACGRRAGCSLSTAANVILHSSAAIVVVSECPKSLRRPQLCFHQSGRIRMCCSLSPFGPERLPPPGRNWLESLWMRLMQQRSDGPAALRWNRVLHHSLVWFYCTLLWFSFFLSTHISPHCVTSSFSSSSFDGPWKRFSSKCLLSGRFWINKATIGTDDE